MRSHLHVVVVVIAALYHVQCAVLHAREWQAMMHIPQALAAALIICITATDEFK